MEGVVAKTIARKELVDDLFAEIIDYQVELLAEQKKREIQRKEGKFWKEQSQASMALAVELSLRLENQQQLAREAIADLKEENKALKRELMALKRERSRVEDYEPRTPPLKRSNAFSGAQFFNEK